MSAAVEQGRMDEKTRELLEMVEGTIAITVPYLTGSFKKTLQDLQRLVREHIDSYKEQGR